LVIVPAIEEVELDENEGDQRRRGGEMKEGMQKRQERTV